MSEQRVVQGVCLQLPTSFHSLVVHVKYRCGHKPQDNGKSTIRLQGDVNPHTGPCLSGVVGSLLRRACVVETMHHEIPTQCPACETKDMVMQGIDMSFEHGVDAWKGVCR